MEISGYNSSKNTPVGNELSNTQPTEHGINDPEVQQFDFISPANKPYLPDQVPELGANAILSAVLRETPIARHNYWGDSIAECSPATTRLQDRLDSTDDLSIMLDVFEASTAYDVLGWQLTARNMAFRPITVASVKQIEAKAAALNMSAGEILALLKSRAYRGEDPEVQGLTPNQRKKYYAHHTDKRAYRLATRFIGVLKETSSYQSASDLETFSALEVHDEERSLTDQIYLQALSENRKNTQLSLTQLRNVHPGNEIEIEFAIQGLESLQREKLSLRDVGKWQSLSVMMLMRMLDQYKAKSKNAEVLHNVLATDRTKSGLSIGPFNVIALANRVRAQLGQPKITGNAAKLVSQYPLAVDTISDLVANKGQNDLEEDEKISLQAYANLLSDVFIVGKYLQDVQWENRTIGEYLTDRPQASAFRFAGEVQEQSATQELDELKQQFGSVVYWRLHQSGYGYHS